MAEKLIRDPVHDVIAFRIDQADEALLFRLVGAAEFQRLRRIRQLGLASLAYPGADHSRFSHCVGVMETARKMLNRLAGFSAIDAESRLLCLVAALLHDLGHGPFSHVFERVTGMHHEEVTRDLIVDGQSEVHGILSDHDAKLPDRVVGLLGGGRPRTYLNDILSSQLDADRFDYLLRDNLMTGSQYGAFDLSWLLQALTLDPSGRLAVAAKGISAVEDYLQSRYHMYRNVYFHKVVRSAEGMVKLAVQRARRLAVQDRLPWPPRDHYVYKALLGQALTHDEYAQFDDVSMLAAFKLWMDCGDQTLAGLCKGLLFRRLFKVIDISFVDDPAEAKRAFAAAQEAVRSAGGDGDYDLFLDEPAETPYASAADGPGGEEQDEAIRVVDAQGRASDFARSSPLIQAMNRQLMFRRIHVLETHKMAAVARIEAALGRKIA